MRNVRVLACLILFLGLALVGAAGAEDKAPSGGIIPKLPVTTNDPELVNGHVYPFWGAVCQRYTYSVVYRDKEGRAPEYVKIYFNGRMIDMEKEDPAAGDYRNGVKYVYQNVPNKLGSNFYYFEASNGLGKARESIIDSPDNGPVLFESAFKKNEIAVISKETGQKIFQYPILEEWVGGVALSDDGRYLAAKTSNRVLFFDTSRPRKPIWEFESKQTGPIGGDVKGGVDISGDGSRVVASIGSSVIFFNNSSNKPIWQYDQAGNAYAVAISKDGKYVAAATAGEEANVNTNLLILWSEKGAKPLWQYHSAGNFHDVSLSDDGAYVGGATGCPDRRAYIFSRNSNEPLVRSEMLTRDSPVHRAKISADGSAMAVGSESNDGAVFMFTKGSNDPVWKFPAPNRRSVRALGFTPDGQYVGAATFGGDAYIFGQSSNEPLASWKINATLGAVDIADDGSFIAAGGTDNKVHILNRNSPEDTGVTFDEYVQEVDISGDGRLIAAGTGGAVYFFETFAKNEGDVFPCQEVIEPEPEGTMGGGAGMQNSYCGDSVCEGPETAANCPRDCDEDLAGLTAKLGGTAKISRVFMVLGLILLVSVASVGGYWLFHSGLTKRR